MNDNENSHKRTSEELDTDLQLDSESNNHHNLELDELGSNDETGSTLPPTKKIRTNEELDIRFLVSSKVSCTWSLLYRLVILIQFSSKEAGAIIGKGGANINNLRKNVRFLSN